MKIHSRAFTMTLFCLGFVWAVTVVRLAFDPQLADVSLWKIAACCSTACFFMFPVLVVVHPGK